MLWASARAKEPWAIQELCRRFAPPTQSLHLIHEIEDDKFDYSKLTDDQLQQLQQAGVGGVMTCFTYPIALDDPAKGIKNERFLSPEFLDTLRYAAEKARQLGLNFGVCGGTGW